MRPPAEMHETPAEYFTRRYAEIEGLISAECHLLHGERKEEAVAEVMAIVWSEFSKLAAAGRDVIRLLPRIIEFAARRERCGRGLANPNPVRDVTSPRCRHRHGYCMSTLPLGDRDPVAVEILEALRDDRSPAEQAICNADFCAWLQTLEPKQRKLAKQLASGLSQTDIARRRKVSRTRVWQLREELWATWNEMFGQ